MTIKVTATGRSSNNTEPHRFKFDGVHDGLDSSADLAKYFQDAISVHNANVVERYKKMEAELVVVLRPGSESDKYHLVFRAIPDVGIGHLKVPSNANICPVTPNPLADRDHEFVLVRDRYFVECPQEIVPSQVRLEADKERLHLFGDILRATDRLPHVIESPSEGKCGVLGVGKASGKRERVSRIIKSIPKILSDLRRNVGDGRWKRFCQLELLHLVSGLIRVRLSDQFVWVHLDELSDFPMKLSEAFLSPIDLLT